MYGGNVELIRISKIHYVSVSVYFVSESEMIPPSNVIVDHVTERNVLFGGKLDNNHYNAVAN
jgi:hypothetical protein